MQVSRGCFGFCQYNWLVGLRMKVVCGVGRLSGAQLGSRGSSWQTGSSSADTRSLPARDSLAAPGPRTCQHGSAAWQGRTHHTHSQISFWSQGSFRIFEIQNKTVETHQIYCNERNQCQLVYRPTPWSARTIFFANWKNLQLDSKGFFIANFSNFVTMLARIVEIIHCR